ncbi:preprotein translocase subunit YajC [Chloroflexota bacterium]
MEILAVLVILLLVIAAYWTLVIMPKQQDFKKHQRFVRQMQTGDKVVTYGGLVGTITALYPDEGLARVQLAEGVEVEIITAALTQPFNSEVFAKNAQIGMEDEWTVEKNQARH